MITPESTRPWINIFFRTKKNGLTDVINAIRHAKKRWRHQRNFTF
jgi:hypothetical protein